VGSIVLQRCGFRSGADSGEVRRNFRVKYERQRWGELIRAEGIQAD